MPPHTYILVVGTHVVGGRQPTPKSSGGDEDEQARSVLTVNIHVPMAVGRGQDRRCGLLGIWARSSAPTLSPIKMAVTDDGELG